MMFIFRKLLRIAFAIACMGGILGLTLGVVVMREAKPLFVLFVLWLVFKGVRSMLRNSSDPNLLEAQLQGQAQRERAAASAAAATVEPFVGTVPQIAVAEAAPEVVREDFAPGVRGAQIALDELAGQLPDGVIAVRFLGLLRAYATWDSYEPVGDFADLTRDDPQYRVVGWMVMYAQAILAGDIDAAYSDDDALSYALARLTPPSCWSATSSTLP